MPSTHTLEALYRLNKHAKKYADDAADAYRWDDGESARIASCRKTALYRFKTYVLQQWYAAGTVSRVDQHTIDGRNYYCLTIDGWQFHTPVGQWASIATALASDDPDETVLFTDADTTLSTPEIPSTLSTDELEATSTLTDFDADSSPNATPDLSPDDALKHLDDEFEASPNNFLDQSFIDVGYRRPDLRFTGWRDLSHARKPPTPPEEGDRVEFAELDGDDERKFLFAADETLDTYDHGEVTITNRYGIYNIPFHSHNNWPIIEPTYDLRFNDEDRTQTGVDQDTVFGFHVLIDDPTAPAQTFDGLLADHVQEIDPAFTIGDTVVFTESIPNRHSDEPTTATITAFSVWETLVDCRLKYDDGTIRWEAYDDFASAVEDTTRH
jgi:hypothetical protein